MAEINRQRKKGIPVWVLLLALIVIALLVWFFWANPKREHAAKPENVIELRAPAPALRGLGIQQVDRQLAVG